MSGKREIAEKSGKYGTLIFTACFMMQAVGIGTYVSYGVFFTPLLNEFDCSRVVISGASSLAFMVMGLVGMLIGRLNDRYGPRLLMSITAVFFGVGFSLMGQAASIVQLYLFYGVLVGIGLSSIDVIALTTIARWFGQRRGLMTGLTKVGTGAGQFVIPLVASLLIGAYGWRQATVLIGVTAGVILFLLAQVLKRDPGELVGATMSDNSSNPGSSRKEAAELGFGKARKTYQFRVLCMVNFLVVLILISILVHIVPHALDIGLSATEAAGVLSAIGGVSIVGRFLAGIGIDRWGSRTIMLISFLLLVTGLLLLLAAESLWMLYLFACVYGLAHGGFFTAVSPIAAETFGISSHGTILGIIVCFGTTGGAIGPLIAGQIFDMTGSYTAAFWSLIATGVIGFCVLLTLRPLEASSR